MERRPLVAATRTAIDLKARAGLLLAGLVWAGAAYADPPFAGDDTFSTDEDTTLNVDTAMSVLNNDTDPEMDPLTAVLVSGPSFGQLALNPDGTFDFTPDPNFNGLDSFTYVANDALEDSEFPATVTITVSSINDPPVGVIDSYNTNDNIVLIIDASSGVLSNDTDADGDSLTATLVDNVNAGVLLLAPDGSFAYTPILNFSGSDSFTYRAGDGTDQSGVTTVAITVNFDNDAPTANDDSYTTAEDTPLSVPANGVLDNDSDDSDNLNAVLVGDVSNGSLSLDSNNGSFNYTPDANFAGDDTFTYRASDGELQSNELATVTITVTPIPDDPVAIDDTATVAEDSTGATLDVLANDTDPDVGDSLTVTAITQPASGTAVIGTGGSNVVYTPNADFADADSFTYTVSDGDGGEDTATVNVTVTGDNDPPVAANDTATVGEDSGANPIDVLANDSDPENDTLTITGISQPTNGTAVITDGGTGLTYAPAPDYSGTETPFTYTISDGNGGENTATVNVTVTGGNDPPVANDDLAVVGEDSGANPIDVLINDSDPESDPLTITAVSQPTNGTVVITGGGTGLTYAPNADYSGTDTPFSYTISDGNGGTDTASVTVTVSSANDSPVAVDDSYDGDEDTQLTVNAANGVLNNDSDPDGDSLSATLNTDTTNGTVSLNADGSFTYAPDADFSGNDSFTYTASDGNGGSATSTVVIAVANGNDLPVAVDDTATVAEDSTGATIDVLANDSDPDVGDNLTVASIIQPESGTAIIGTGSLNVVYTPDADFAGPDSFTYTVSDGNGGEDTATVTLTVSGDNDPPVANDDLATIDEDSTDNSIDVLVNDSDPDGDILTITSVSTPANGTATITSGGTGITYTPNADFSGDDSLTYTIEDTSALSASATVSITVTSANDTPVAVADSYNTDEDAPLTVDATTGVLANDTDADNDALTAVLDTDVANGTLDFNADGSFDYTPDTDFDGVDSFTYFANDGTENGTPAATVTITVGAVDDAPTAVNDAYDTPEDTVLVIAAPGVLANDTDQEVDLLTASIVGTTTNGTLAFNTDGSFQYTPNADFDLVDSFTYVANDGNSDSAPATVTITIIPANDPPIAANDEYFTDEDQTLTVSGLATPGVLDNDTDFDGDLLTALISDSTTNGLLTLNANGTFTYNPDLNFNGTDEFTYTVSDGNGGQDMAVVSITVSSVNDPPEGPDEPIDAGVATENVPYTFDLAPFFSDNDGDALFFRADQGAHPFGLPLSGTLQIDESGTATGFPGRIFGTIGVDDTSDLGPRSITVTVADRPFTDPAGQEKAVTVLLTLAARDRIDVSLTAAATPNPALVEQPVEWQLSIGNASPLETINLIELDLTFSGVPATISDTAGCTVVARTVNCLVGPVQPNGVLVQSITAQPESAGELTLLATAFIAGDTGFEPVDPNVDNNQVFVTLNVGQGFSSGPSQSFGGSSRGNASGDINGDGYVDLVLVKNSGQSTALYLSEPVDPEDPERELYRRISTTPIQLGDSGVASQDALLTDIDNDGDLDLIVANGAAGSPQGNSVYLNNSHDGLAEMTPAGVLGGETTWHLAAADLNLDGFVDLIAANGSPNEVFLNQRNGVFDAGSVPGDNDSRAVAVADFDGDGWPDLVFANLDAPSTLHLGLGNGNFGPPIEIESEPANSVRTGEFGGTGLPDILFSHPFSTAPATPIKTLHVNQSVAGAPSFAREVVDSLGSSPTLELALLDVTLDGSDDIVALNSTGTHQIFVAQGSVFALHPVQFSSPAPTGSTSNDFNNDGRPDLAVSGPTGVNLFLNDGFGNLGAGDITPPVLSLIGAPNITLTVQSAFSDPGATATDDADGSLTSRIVIDNPVNTTVIGSYTVTYRVTDRSGNNAAPISRQVTVQASQPTGGGGGGSFGIEVLVLMMFACILRWRCRTNARGQYE